MQNVAALYYRDWDVKLLNDVKDSWILLQLKLVLAFYLQEQSSLK